MFVHAPSFLKQSQTKVPLPLSLARDPDVVVTKVLDLLAHPGSLGEGQTACDIMERPATPVTLSTGGEVRDTPRHPSPSSTTLKVGRLYGSSAHRLSLQDSVSSW